MESKTKRAEGDRRIDPRLLQRQLAAKDWYRPRAAKIADLGSFQPGQHSHTNVARWLALYPHHSPVRGWQVHLDVFLGYSIIDTGAEKVDITPQPARDGLRFLPFRGSDEAFWGLQQEVPRLA